MKTFKGKAIYQPKGKAGELWKDIEGFNGLYQVSDYGNIRSLPRNGTTTTTRSLKLNISNRTGYVNVCLCKNNVKFQKRVNRLVALAFIPNPNNLPEVNHIDGNKQNNSSDNLEWCTNSDNKKHAYRIGLLSRKGVLNNSSKLTPEIVGQIRKNLIRGISQSIISKEFNISQQTVSDIKLKKIWNYEID